MEIIQEYLLEREKMMDTEPGYKKKIKAAFDEAAEKSHKVCKAPHTISRSNLNKKNSCLCIFDILEEIKTFSVIKLTRTNSGNL